MPPKKVEGVTLDEEKLTDILELLESEETASQLEALQTLLRGVEASKDVHYAMVENDVVGLASMRLKSEDPQIALCAARLIARYATSTGLMRKMARSAGNVQLFWQFLQQYKRETAAKAEYEARVEAEAEAAANDPAAAAPAAGKKDKGKDKDKSAKAGKSKANLVEDPDAPVFNIPSAALLEAVLRGLKTMAMVDTRAIDRINAQGDMEVLIGIMTHPVALIQERSDSLVSTLLRSASASVLLVKAGLQDVLLARLEEHSLPRRLQAVRLLTKIAAVPDARLAAYAETGAVPLLIRYASGLSPLGEPPVEATATKDAKKDKGKDKGKGKEDAEPELSPEVQELMIASGELLALLEENVPEIARKTTSYTGWDVLHFLLPQPVPKQLEKYGLPPLPEPEPEEEEEAEAGAEEEGEEAEAEEAPPPVEEKSDAALKDMMKSKKARDGEAEEKARLEAEEAQRLEEGLRRQQEEAEAARRDEEENRKEMPTLKPVRNDVHEAVLGVVRGALRNPALRETLRSPPWPQLLLHILYHSDAPPPEPEPEKDTKGGKGAKGAAKPDPKATAKPKKGKEAQPVAEENDQEQEWVDPSGPMHPPFTHKMRTMALECCAELLQNGEQQDNALVQHVTRGEEFVWLGRLVDELAQKSDPLDPLDVTLATRLALAIGDIGLGTPLESLVGSGYIPLVKSLAAVAQRSKCIHFREAVGRAALVLPGDEHFMAKAEPPPPSPAITPAPDPLVTSKYLWDALGKPVVMDGFSMQTS